MKNIKKDNNNKNPSNKKDITGIFVLAFGILLILSLYYNLGLGVISDIFAPFVFGLFGITGYFIPATVTLYGIFLIFGKENRNIKSQLFYILILYVITSAIIHTLFINFENYKNLKPFEKIVEFYREGVLKNGGGFFGGIFSTPLITLFQRLGTIIILLTVCVIDILLITGFSLSETVSKIRSKNIKSKKDKRKSISLKEAKKERNPVFLEEVITTESNLRKLRRPRTLNFKINDEEILPEIKTNRTKINKTVTAAKTAAKATETIKKEEKSDTYIFPPLNLLKSGSSELKNEKEHRLMAIEGAKKLESILLSFGIEAKIVNISRGPAITRYELQPKAGIKVSKIVNLSDDISLGMATSGVRIEAPIPGKAAIGIEIPNRKVSQVYAREVISSPNFDANKSSLAFAMGTDITGESIVADIGKMPHLLIAGATGAGKSVCINCLIISILYKSSPDEVKMVMIDPKVVELGVYNGIPHLLIPVVTEPKKAAAALLWAVSEMEARYKKFAAIGVRNIESYNKAILKKNEENEKKEEEEEEKKLPKILIIIDELADLMMVAPNDVEESICRLAQMARAAGMHLVIATQRPSVNVITGVIKANIPTRISFAVSSHIDSRTILDMAGAEKLMGKGDMLYLPVGRQKPIRIQGAFISEKEVEDIIKFLSKNAQAEYDEDVIEEINTQKPGDGHGVGEEVWDEILPKAVDMVIEMGQASVSLIQRKFRVGYARAARIIDQMEERGIVSGFEGSKPRNILISRQEWQEMKTTANDSL